MDEILSKRLRSIGAVLLEGPKWCGKSTTGVHHSRSEIILDDPRNREQYKLLIETNPELILDGETPRLLDEWQIVPKIWDAVRYTVDRRRKPGQFILTGSAKPADRDQIYHSGTGRFAWLKMRTMSLFESGDSTGEVSIRRLFEDTDNFKGCIAKAGLQQIAYLICRGGWPLATELSAEAALAPAFDYYNAVVNVDISNVDGVDRSVERAKRLMRSYARYQGTQTSVAQIVKDVNGSDNGGFDDKTARSYLNVLRSLFVIEDMPAWNPNLKSKTAIRAADTRYFIDPSIATSALGIGPGDLLKDLKAFGLLFETLCVRDLRVYCQPLGGEVYHYRDKNGLECDAVIHLPNGEYGLIEIKLGGDSLIESGAKTLIKLSEKIDTEKMSAPSFLMVLTAVGEYAYKRADGVLVVPVTALGV